MKIKIINIAFCEESIEVCVKKTFSIFESYTGCVIIGVGVLAISYFIYKRYKKEMEDLRIEAEYKKNTEEFNATLERQKEAEKKEAEDILKRTEEYFKDTTPEQRQEKYRVMDEITAYRKEKAEIQEMDFNNTIRARIQKRTGAALTDRQMRDYIDLEERRASTTDWGGEYADIRESQRQIVEKALEKKTPITGEYISLTRPWERELKKPAEVKTLAQEYIQPVIRKSGALTAEEKIALEIKKEALRNSPKPPIPQRLDIRPRPPAPTPPVKKTDLAPLVNLEEETKTPSQTSDVIPQVTSILPITAIEPSIPTVLPPTVTNAAGIIFEIGS